MRRFALLYRIAYAVIFIFLVILLVSTLKELDDAKAKRDRCSATTQGYIDTVTEETHRRSVDSDKLEYRFTINGVEYKHHKSYNKTIGEKAFKEGEISVHYNPDQVSEYYLGDTCYEVEHAKDHLLLTALMWVILIIMVIVHIVRSIRTPEYYDD